MSTFRPLSEIYSDNYKLQEEETIDKINDAKHLINMYHKTGDVKLKRTAIQVKKEAEEAIKETKKLRKIAYESEMELEKFRTESLAKLKKKSRKGSPRNRKI